MSNHRKPFANVVALVLFALGLAVWPQALVAQQWDGSSGTTGTIYRDGEIQGRGPQGGIFKAISPNNPDAYVALSWLEDVARIRVGGVGTGATNGLDIQRTSNVSLLRLKANGRVGIGTTDPAQRLHVVGDGLLESGSGAELNLLNTTSGTMWQIVSGVNSGFEIGNVTRGDIDTAAPFYIAQAGKVGIGTTSPGAKLHVAGDLHVDAGEGLQLLGEDNYWGTYKDARIFRMIDKSSSSSGGWVDGGIVFERYTASDGVSKEVMVLRGTNGRVGIGVHEPSHKLDVAGTVRAHEVIVESTGADFVFDEGYDLPTLEEVATHIEQHGHLPEIPSAAQMQAEGVSLAAFTTTLLRKIEELTLYAIEQHNDIQALLQHMTEQQEHIRVLTDKVQHMEGSN